MSDRFEEYDQEIYGQNALSFPCVDVRYKSFTENRSVYLSQIKGLVETRRDVPQFFHVFQNGGNCWIDLIGCDLRYIRQMTENFGKSKLERTNKQFRMSIEKCAERGFSSPGCPDN